MMPSVAPCFVPICHSIVLNLNWPFMALANRTWQKGCYARAPSSLLEPWAAVSSCSAAAGGQGGALGPRILVEEALLDVQPTLDHGVQLRIRGQNWTLPSKNSVSGEVKWQLTIQAWEPPNQGVQAAPSLLTEPWQIIINCCFKPVNFGVVHHTAEDKHWPCWDSFGDLI